MYRTLGIATCAAHEDLAAKAFCVRCGAQACAQCLGHESACAPCRRAAPPRVRYAGASLVGLLLGGLVVTIAAFAILPDDLPPFGAIAEIYDPYRRTDVPFCAFSR